jgi:hypothetical protein
MGGDPMGPSVTGAKTQSPKLHITANPAQPELLKKPPLTILVGFLAG